ncbi:hypothetical protein [Bacillus badius]|uniref:hypothetical protein n=1 Tax=Bacillus badius TaxID=1455 RepID=UPI0005972AFE|nr:hypothetical protein [Bacillus badius]MED4718166.1 hypothetical protein [Bacillus badius]
MKIPTHENKFLKNCLNCENPITDLTEDHLFCTQCGFPIRNECTGTTKFNSGYAGDPVEHDIEDDFYVLNPEDAFCPKCGSESLFNIKSLINVQYPRVEIIDPEPVRTLNDEDDLPF